MRESSRALAAGIDLQVPTGDEQNLLGSARLELAFIALSASEAHGAPSERGVWWNGRACWRATCARSVKADMPDQFHCGGTDLAVNPRLSLVLDLLGQRLVRSPQLSTFDFSRRSVSSVNLRDLQFQTASFWTSSYQWGSRPIWRRAC